MYSHLDSNNLIPVELKGCRNGTKDHSLIDRLVMETARCISKNLFMAWVDYKKAI